MVLGPWVSFHFCHSFAHRCHCGEDATPCLLGFSLYYLKECARRTWIVGHLLSLPQNIYLTFFKKFINFKEPCRWSSPHIHPRGFGLEGDQDRSLPSTGLLLFVTGVARLSQARPGLSQEPRTPSGSPTLSRNPVTWVVICSLPSAGTSASDPAGCVPEDAGIPSSSVTHYTTCED